MCLQSAVHAGQVKVPPGYHPIDVEKEWGRLHVAMLERERLLRIEFERSEQWPTCKNKTTNHMKTLNIHVKINI